MKLSYSAKAAGPVIVAMVSKEVLLEMLNTVSYQALHSCTEISYTLSLHVLVVHIAMVCAANLLRVCISFCSFRKNFVHYKFCCPGTR